MKRAFVLTTATCIFIALVATPAGRAQAGPSSGKSLEITAENADALHRLQDYPNLEVLSINCLENLQALPDSIGVLKNLRELLIDNGNGCSMNPALPESIGSLTALRKLVLFGAQDPRPAGKDNGPQPLRRHPFPKAMSQLTSLTSLDLGRNGLEEIPDFVKDLPHLKELEFRWNIKLKKVPAFLLQLRELQTLGLNADGLTDLPDFLKQLPKLTYITLGDNCKITQNAQKKQDLERRFPHIRFDFEDEYDCPGK